MTKKIFIGVVLFSSLSAVAMASEARLVNGAGTLPQGDMALSLDLGFDLPEPLLTAVAFDYGVTDKLQLGVDGSFAGLLYAAGLRSNYNFWRSADASHFVSFRFSPHYIQIYAVLADLKMLALDPALAYEYRWGEKKGGVFAKLGPMLDYISAGSDVFNGIFKTSSANQTFWASSLRSSVGVQQQFGDHFSMTAEMAYIVGFSKMKSFPAGKLGLTWAF